MRTLTNLRPTLLLAFIFVIHLSSCYPYTTGGPVTVPESRQKDNYLYVPTSPNAPFLTDKNDLSASLHGSFGDHHSGVELQAAFIPIKHLGLITNYSSGGNNSAEISYHHFEAGAGYVTKLARCWYFEAYAGHGSGDIDNRYSTGTSAIKNSSFFIQPSVFFVSRKKNVRVGFISKLNTNRFNISNTSFNQDQEPYSTNQIQIIKAKPDQLFFEQGVICRFGWENFLFHTGFSFSQDLTSSELHYVRENLAPGVTFKLNTGKKQ